MGGIGSGRPADRERYARIIQMRREGLSFRLIGQELGVSRSAANHLFRKAVGTLQPARISPLAPPPPRVWCRQCERNVLMAEADQCGSPFCKALEQAA